MCLKLTDKGPAQVETLRVVGIGPSRSYCTQSPDRIPDVCDYPTDDETLPTQVW